MIPLPPWFDPLNAARFGFVPDENKLLPLAADWAKPRSSKDGCALPSDESPNSQPKLRDDVRAAGPRALPEPGVAALARPPR